MRPTFATSLLHRPAALVALAALAAVGCGGPADETPPASAPGATEAVGGARGTAPRVSPRPALRPDALLAPDWPDGWVVAEASAAGPEALPVISWRIEARGETPEDAAAAALDALRPLAGEIVLDDVRAEPATANAPARAVGQLRGSRLRAGVLATEMRGTCELSVTVELLPGAADRD
ncbi:MAG: hypothetical protein Kow0062_15150 [Acidobacteriota bacterium]